MKSMIVYSVHPESVYRLMREQGYLEGKPELAMFPEEYQWMVKQMKKRLPHFDGNTYPIWVWKRRVNRNEPNLLSPGQRGVILKLDIPEEDILWSSFNEWHTILNHSPFTFDEAEWNLFKEKGFPEDEVQKTWERLFDFKWLASRPVEWAGPPNPQEWMQGVTPRITMEQVLRVERFIPKLRDKK